MLRVRWWPSVSASIKRLRYYWRRMLRVRATPHEVAAGCAVGVFAACTPFIGLQMILAGGLAYMLRASIPAALLGTFVGNPLSWPAIWSASYVAGAWVLGLDPVLAADQLSEGANALGETLMAPTPENIDAAVGNLSSAVPALFLGGMIVGLILAVSSYYPTRRAVRIFQKRRKAAA